MVDLRDVDAISILAVKDLEAARPFSEKVLGLRAVVDPANGVAVYASGRSRITVYESEFAGTNRANALVWAVPDVDEVVGKLRERGVTFEHYTDLPGITLEGDVHVAEGFKGAWFTDPDGNILHINDQVSS